MGYPMTYRRVIHRNGIAEGDYDTQGPTAPGWAGFNAVEQVVALVPEMAARELAAAQRWRRMLLGDLRRFERDLVDEDSVCKRIAEETGVDPEAVAVVLVALTRW